MHNNTVCCVHEVHAGPVLYCKLWTSLAYYYNASIADFKYSVFKILTFINFNDSENNT